ncbi:hypothetical protein CBR_g21934 [Chara braunii]|uniref:Uncharacterized protein n=1 Tax=Chara braunii TaxID=69332 RepID=A0A388L1K5_CHABU|nr:hypothetical protein CBR_g21934 [Chara braunii]|eukprot:GBG76185.1 hypothetical protein CBR_g21934 [Chara braunii]
MAPRGQYQFKRQEGRSGEGAGGQTGRGHVPKSKKLCGVHGSEGEMGGEGGQDVSPMDVPSTATPTPGFGRDGVSRERMIALANLGLLGTPRGGGSGTVRSQGIVINDTTPQRPVSSTSTIVSIVERTDKGQVPVSPLRHVDPSNTLMPGQTGGSSRVIASSAQAGSPSVHATATTAGERREDRRVEEAGRKEERRDKIPRPDCVIMPGPDVPRVRIEDPAQRESALRRARRTENVAMRIIHGWIFRSSSRSDGFTRTESYVAVDYPTNLVKAAWQSVEWSRVVPPSVVYHTLALKMGIPLWYAGAYIEDRPEDDDMAAHQESTVMRLVSYFHDAFRAGARDDDDVEAEDAIYDADDVWAGKDMIEEIATARKGKEKVHDDRLVSRVWDRWGSLDDVEDLDGFLHGSRHTLHIMKDNEECRRPEGGSGRVDEGHHVDTGFHSTAFDGEAGCSERPSEGPIPGSVAEEQRPDVGKLEASPGREDLCPDVEQEAAAMEATPDMEQEAAAISHGQPVPARSHDGSGDSSMPRLAHDHSQPLRRGSVDLSALPPLPARVSSVIVDNTATRGKKRKIADTCAVEHSRAQRPPGRGRPRGHPPGGRSGRGRGRLGVAGATERLLGSLGAIGGGSPSPISADGVRTRSRAVVGKRTRVHVEDNDGTDEQVSGDGSESEYEAPPQPSCDDDDDDAGGDDDDAAVEDETLVDGC